MGGQFFSEVPCILCRKPLDLQADLCADEHGKAVHEACYIQQIAHQAKAVPRSHAN